MKVTEKFVFFFGGSEVFSNFYSMNFFHKGIQFFCSEQAVMYEKAMLFNATDVAGRILKATNARQCKALGRSREIPFNEAVWVRNRERIYKEVLLSKFSYDTTKEVLLRTDERTLVEASPYDTIWGVGLGEDDVNILDPTKWRGMNLLGKVLMEVRQELRNV